MKKENRRNKKEFGFRDFQIKKYPATSCGGRRHEQALGCTRQDKSAHKMDNLFVGNPLYSLFVLSFTEVVRFQIASYLLWLDSHSCEERRAVMSRKDLVNPGYECIDHDQPADLGHRDTQC